MAARRAAAALLLAALAGLAAPAGHAAATAAVRPHAAAVTAAGAARPGGQARPALDPPVPERDPGEVRDTARRVLRRAEFQPAQRTPLQVAWEWLLEQLGILIGQLASGGAGAYVVLALVLLVLAAVALVAVRFSLSVTKDPAAAAALPAAPGRSSAEWRAEAEAHERAGEWRQAVRCRYRALVADLAARGLLEEVPGRTAGEYRGEVRRNAPLVADDFAGATELFELAWYARWPTGRDDAGHLRTLADRVLAGVSG
ncbi:MAG TPA: DUF4129 domain-containing protein [Actinomycetes bacterium]